jgi:acyl-coenzyme A thioesterase PaaI-like protein
VTTEDLQRVIDDSAFAKSYQFVVKSIAEGSCTIFVPFLPHFERPGGIVSGQVYITAADVAMWLAIKTVRGIDDPSVTASMATQFLKSSQREPFLCTATVMTWSRRTMFGTAECLSASGDRLAFHTLTYVTP